MTFMFDGKNCQSSSNSQNDDLFLCVDYDTLLPNDDNIYVVFSDSKTKKKKKDNKKKDDKNKREQSDSSSNDVVDKIMIGEDEDVYFKGFLASGILFDVSAGDDNYNSKSKLPANMNVNIYSNSSNNVDGDGSTAAPVLLQSFSFHSSCSQNLYLGDQFGSIKLVGFEYHDGTVDKCY